MKKVLVISYYFPPDTEIGGRRAYGLMNHLHRFGWQVHIITACPLSAEVYGSNGITSLPVTDQIDEYLKKTSIGSIDKLDSMRIFKKIPALRDFVVTIFSDVFFFPDPQKNWYKPVLEYLEDNVDLSQFDALITTSKPETAHLIGKKLKKSHNIPWIADYRDLWSLFHFYQYSWGRRIIDTWLEHRTVSKADAITTVSTGLQEKLNKFHRRQIYSIMNGFNEEEINHSSLSPSSASFIISYTGTVYYGKQDPSMLFQALGELIADGHREMQNLRIQFYGNIQGRNKSHILDNANKYNVGSNIEILPSIPHETVLEKQRNSQVLLFLDWNDRKYKGVITGKLFEYLAARRPILSIGTNDSSDVNQILTITNAGRHITDIEELKDELLNSYHLYKKSGAVPYHGTLPEILKFGQKEMARRFAEVLDTVTSGNI